jgi:hypothetical protein
MIPSITPDADARGRLVCLALDAETRSSASLRLDLATKTRSDYLRNLSLSRLPIVPSKRAVIISAT